MTEAEFSVVLAKISRFYPRFYDGQDAKKVAHDWYTVGGFENISFSQVDRAVTAYCNTNKFPPSLADIKAQMVESYLQNKPTAMQAFQLISMAVKKSAGKDDSIKQYNELPPIMKKLVGDPTQLQDWYKVSEEAFQTVIMSAIRESYKELANREAKYYAFPGEIQVDEHWRIESPEAVALPEPKRIKTIDELLDDMVQDAKDYREKHGIQAKDKYNERVNDFKRPMTDEEIKAIEKRLKGEQDDKGK